MKRILVKVLGFVFLIIFLIYNYSTFKEYFHRMRLVHFVWNSIHHLTTALTLELIAVEELTIGVWHQPKHHLHKSKENLFDVWLWECLSLVLCWLLLEFLYIWLLDQKWKMLWNVSIFLCSMHRWLEGNKVKNLLFLQIKEINFWWFYRYFNFMESVKVKFLFYIYLSI